ARRPRLRPLAQGLIKANSASSPSCQTPRTTPERQGELVYATELAAGRILLLDRASDELGDRQTRALRRPGQEVVLVVADHDVKALGHGRRCAGACVHMGHHMCTYAHVSCPLPNCASFATGSSVSLLATERTSVRPVEWSPHGGRRARSAR